MFHSALVHSGSHTVAELDIQYLHDPLQQTRRVETRETQVQILRNTTLRMLRETLNSLNALASEFIHFKMHVYPRQRTVAAVYLLLSAKDLIDETGAGENDTAGGGTGEQGTTGGGTGAQDSTEDGTGGERGERNVVRILAPAHPRVLLRTDKCAALLARTGRDPCFTNMLSAASDVTFDAVSVKSIETFENLMCLCIAGQQFMGVSAADRLQCLRDKFCTAVVAVMQAKTASDREYALAAFAKYPLHVFFQIPRTDVAPPLNARHARLLDRHKQVGPKSIQRRVRHESSWDVITSDCQVMVVREQGDLFKQQFGTDSVEISSCTTTWGYGFLVFKQPASMAEFQRWRQLKNVLEGVEHIARIALGSAAEACELCGGRDTHIHLSCPRAETASDHPDVRGLRIAVYCITRAGYAWQEGAKARLVHNRGSMGTTLANVHMFRKAEGVPSFESNSSSILTTDSGSGRSRNRSASGAGSRKGGGGGRHGDSDDFALLYNDVFAKADQKYHNTIRGAVDWLPRPASPASSPASSPAECCQRLLLMKGIADNVSSGELFATKDCNGVAVETDVPGKGDCSYACVVYGKARKDGLSTTRAKCLAFSPAFSGYVNPINPIGLLRRQLVDSLRPSTVWQEAVRSMASEVKRLGDQASASAEFMFFESFLFTHDVGGFRAATNRAQTDKVQNFCTEITAKRVVRAHRHAQVIEFLQSATSLGGVPQPPSRQGVVDWVVPWIFDDAKIWQALENITEMNIRMVHGVKDDIVSDDAFAGAQKVHWPTLQLLHSGGNHYSVRKFIAASVR